MIGKIYKVFDNSNENKIYIGSTFQDIELRLKQHKNAFISYLKGKSKYYSVFDIFLNVQIIDNINIKLIEEIECQSEYELKKHEEHTITNFLLNNKEYQIVNLNKPINEKKYQINKSYRDMYKYGKKSRIVVRCPCCNQQIKISISPNSCRNIFDELDYSDE